jgi:hypothetical protein
LDVVVKRKDLMQLPIFKHRPNWLNCHGLGLLGSCVTMSVGLIFKMHANNYDRTQTALLFVMTQRRESPTYEQLIHYLLTRPLRSHWNIGAQLYNCWGFYSG